MRFLSSKILAATCVVCALVFLVVAGVLESRAALMPGVALMLGALVFGVRASLGRHPGAADTERFLVDLLVKRGFGGAFHLDGVKSRAARLFGRNWFTVKFSADVTFTEPLYQATKLTAEMCGRINARRVSALTVVARRLATELGPQADGIEKRIPPDPFDREYIMAASTQGLKISVGGDVRVGWKDGLWLYSLTDTTPEFDMMLKIGLPRAAFRDAVVLDSTDGKMWLRDVMRAWERFEQDVGSLQRIAEEARTERAREAAGRFFTNVHAGTVFAGMGETHTRQVPPTPFFVEIISVDRASGTVSFLLRNDSGWGYARPFTGVVAGEPSGEAILLMGHTRACDAHADTGPLLSAASDFGMELRWVVDPGDRMIVSSGDFVLKLERVSDETLLNERARIFPREPLVRAACAPGLKYVGHVRTDGDSAAVSLNLIEASGNGTASARVEGEGWSALFDVSVAVNRYASEPADLHLLPRKAAAGDDEEGGGGVDGWERVRLSVDGNRLEGFVETQTEKHPIRLRRFTDQ